mmetsp:Transcript_14581/g.19186  ORF Transcript_14581/g.19186 Transcript_14581/m.19186 type:complete len:272 (-) Transcript_14581:327-1142(-)
MEGRRESTREKKQVARLEYNEADDKKPEAIEQKGSGTALGDIEAIKSAMSSVGSEEEILKLLHQTLYNKPGKKTTRKKTLREFNGFPEEVVEAKRQKFEGSKWTTELLKTLCSILCIERTGNKKADMVNAVMEFLTSPDEAKASNVPSKKRKSKGSAKPKPKKKKGTKGKKKAKKPKVPKPLTAYIYFSTLIRPTVKEEHPDLSITEISKKIGELWGEKTDEEKQQYKQEAIDDFKKKYPNGPPKPKQDDGDDDEEDEEEAGDDADTDEEK